MYLVKGIRYETSLHAGGLVDVPTTTQYLSVAGNHKPSPTKAVIKTRDRKGRVVVICLFRSYAPSVLSVPHNVYIKEDVAQW